ncbi:MAG: hypothetical protein AUK47_09965 [Deltaproteobacteria bacterium CG2_30_63_29]|nr:MAG: hypothetical protein AUK47_09965 [Deltaproteobacteria bacterium CG2_30_63_29]PJB48083.1 MAG: hypothetical protein CO108_03020 [Deltaproteobacteria bacterium CG_4_9_14_3_um_filter_63_12]
MSTYKTDVTQKFGKYRATFFDATAKAEESEFATLDDAVAFVKKQASKLDFEEDSVIFRGIAYSTISSLVQEIKSGRY